MCFQDKKYATDKYKDIYTELSIVKAKAERDLGRLRDQLQLAHEALGEPALEEVERGGYGTKTRRKTHLMLESTHPDSYLIVTDTFLPPDIMKSKSNPDILKMAAAAAKRSERTMRSKVSVLWRGMQRVLSDVLIQVFSLNSITHCIIAQATADIESG